VVTVELADLPADLRRLASAATDVGWSVTATKAHEQLALEGEPLKTVALRFGHDDYRCYGVWTLTTTPTGKPGVKWRGGAARHVPPGPLDTLAKLRRYLGVAQ